MRTDNFKAWVAGQYPDVLHFNFGIHDASLLPDGEHQVILSQYRLNMLRFITRAKELKRTKIIWATTTPLYVPEPDKPIVQWRIREEAEIERYNAASIEIAKSEGLHINDLHDAIIRNDFTKCINETGVHMTHFGHEVVSNAVVKAISAVM